MNSNRRTHQTTRTGRGSATRSRRPSRKGRLGPALPALPALCILFSSVGAPTDASDGPSRGQTECQVPSGAYPTIASSVLPECEGAFVQPGDFAEDVFIDREFRLLGATHGTTRILGTLHVDTASLVVLDDLFVEESADPDAIFVDGFESGDTNAWSGAS